MCRPMIINEWPKAEHIARYIVNLDLDKDTDQIAVIMWQNMSEDERDGVLDEEVEYLYQHSTGDGYRMAKESGYYNDVGEWINFLRHPGDYDNSAEIEAGAYQRGE